MKEVLIFSTNEVAQRINYYLNNGDSVTPMTAKGFMVDDAYYKEPELDGKEIFRYSDAKEKFAGKIPVIVCVGYSDMNENRKIIFNKLLADGWDISSYISVRTVIESNDMGIGNIFIGSSSMEFKSRIGNGNIFLNGHLHHHSTVGNFNFFSNNIINGNVKIGDCCFFGSCSCVADETTVHDKTLVGASCYLNRSTKESGLCFAAPKAILWGSSEAAMNHWMSR